MATRDKIDWRYIQENLANFRTSFGGSAGGMEAWWTNEVGDWKSARQTTFLGLYQQCFHEVELQDLLRGSREKDESARVPKRKAEPAPIEKPAPPMKPRKAYAREFL